MKSRFTYLFRDKTPLQIANCPVVSVERALLRDNEHNRSLAQLNFLWESVEPIESLTATIIYKDATGKALGSTVYEYKNLSCTQGEYFGADCPVLIPDGDACSIALVHVAAQRADGTLCGGKAIGRKASVAAAPKVAPVPVRSPQSNAPARSTEDAEKSAQEVAARKEQLAQEAAERKERLAQEAAERKERLAQEAAVRKERMLQEAAAKKEQLAQAAAAKAEVEKVRRFAKAKLQLEGAKTPKDVRKAEKMFLALAEYEGCHEQLEACHTKLKELALQMMQQPKSPKALKEAEEILRSLGDDEELTALIEQCHAQYEEQSAQKGSKTKKLVKGIVIAVVVIALAVAAVPVGKTYILPAVKYAQADKLAKDGSYDEAIAIFAELGEYKDAQHRTWQTTYAKGVYLLEHCEYAAASDIFKSLHDFEDAKERHKEAEYLYGEELLNEKKYGEAAGHLMAAGQFADAESLLNDCYLQWATEEYRVGNYENVISLAENISDWGEPATTPDTDSDLTAEQLEIMEEAGMEIPDFTEATEVTENDGVPEFYKDALYQVAWQKLEAGALTEAVALFTRSIDYLDSADLRTETMYNYVLEHMDSGDEYTVAYLNELVEANFADSKKLAEQVYAWSAEITANNSSTSKEGQDSITGTKTCYFHITLKGGNPGESIPVYAKVRYPGGKTERIELGTLKHNEYNYVYFNSWGNYPKGNCTVTVYNGNTNREIARHTVKIT